jgi:TonB family protein
MKSRYAVFDHDLEYGRGIRIASVVALVSITAAFLFAPQPQVPPYRLRGVVEWDYRIDDPGPIVVVASDNPQAQTIARNTSFNELKPDITVPTLAVDVPFWKVERKPKLVHEVKPDYPEMARAAGIEGKAVVSMVVDTLGNVAYAEVYATSGNLLLDQAAVAAAYQCRFSPGFQRDRPVTVRQLILPFNFKLQ